jgi:histidinol phosphatase-like PHP family hydrolase
MIDLHTHTLLSDGELLPSELVRRAEVKGYTAIALTDHVDSSNIDFVIPRIVKVCRTLNSRWQIRAIPGVEITHVPLEEIKPLVRFARRSGAKIVVVHGETVSEPVISGTNRAGIEAGCDILAHPGKINRRDVIVAIKKGVYLELTSRKNHCLCNRHIAKMARRYGAKLVLNNDAHSGDDLITEKVAYRLLKNLGLKREEADTVLKNSETIAKRCKN